jgi:hypothetical protein
MDFSSGIVIWNLGGAGLLISLYSSVIHLRRQLATDSGIRCRRCNNILAGSDRRCRKCGSVRLRAVNWSAARSNIYLSKLATILLWAFTAIWLYMGFWAFLWTHGAQLKTSWQTTLAADGPIVSVKFQSVTEIDTTSLGRKSQNSLRPSVIYVFTSFGPGKLLQIIIDRQKGRWSCQFGDATNSGRGYPNVGEIIPIVPSFSEKEVASQVRTDVNAIIADVHDMAAGGAPYESIEGRALSGPIIQQSSTGLKSPLILAAVINGIAFIACAGFTCRLKSSG